MKEGGPSFEKPKDLNEPGVRASKEEFEAARERHEALEETVETNERIMLKPEEAAGIHEKIEAMAKEEIKNATTFEELRQAVRGLNSIPGSQKTYTPQEVEDILKRVEEGFGSSYAPRAFGIREKAEELLNREKVAA